MAQQGLYNTQYSDRIVGNKQRNSIITRLARYCVKTKGKYVIVLVSRVAHVRLLSALLKDIPHQTVFGEKDVQERQAATKEFEKGKIKLIIANQVFQKGVNIKRVDVIIDGAGMKSKNNAIQKFGRGVRRHEDKEGLMYFDITDIDPAPVTKTEVAINNSGKQYFKKKTVYHRFHVAQKLRKKAFVATKIPMKDFRWEADGEIISLYKMAEKFLLRETKKWNKKSNQSE